MFFKTSNPSALAAWQKYQQDCQTVKDEAKRLEAVLNVACRPVFVSGISGFCFKGLRFMDDKYPFHRDLWRKPTASNGWSCTPRTSRIPKTLRVASDELNILWREYSPVTYARTMTCQQMGEYLGRNKDSVRCRAGMIGAGLTKCGELRPGTRISDDDVRLIRALRDSDYPRRLSFREIGEKFGISEHSAHAVYYRRRTAEDAVLRELTP